MNPCTRTDLVERYLDGELSPAETADFRAHLLACGECEAELALMRRVFDAVRDDQLLDAPPHLSRRILDHVLPSRIRSRWLRAFGVGYAAAAAASVAIAVGLVALPGPRGLLVDLAMAASNALARTLVLTLEALSFSVLGVAGGWGLMRQLGERLSPLMRAANALFDHPGVAVTLTVALLTCALVLWWMRPRDRSTREEIGHVGLLGF